MVSLILYVLYRMDLRKYMNCLVFLSQGRRKQNQRGGGGGGAQDSSGTL